MAKQSGPDKTTGERWNGLNIEIQYRTEVQHAWATAVEICDNYTDNHGKFSSAPTDYLEYFRCASELLSRRFEDCVGCLPNVKNSDLVKRFNDLEDAHGMLRTLKGINPNNQHFDDERHTLLIFDEEHDVVHVETFADFRTAVAEYFKLERDAKKGIDVVLVAADDPESVRFGFKNYFSDARDFVDFITVACKDLR